MRRPARVLLALLFTAVLAPRTGMAQLAEVRTFDGTQNNLANPTWGAVNTPLLRCTNTYYADGISSPAGPYPSPRAVSNAVLSQAVLTVNSDRLSDMTWQWGQFIDHDFSRTPVHTPFESLDIPVPMGDEFFDPASQGNQFIFLQRSRHTPPGAMRQQINTLSAYLDGSVVYGSDLARANELRTLDGTGRLKVSAGNLMPLNVNRFANDPDKNDSLFFLAGDVRANEQVGLIAIHTLFVREHNWHADAIKAAHPTWTDEQIYQMARALVTAEIQVITYQEFLPKMIGPNRLAPYVGYQPDVNAGIENLFSTAALRIGHTMLSGQLLRLEADGSPIPQGNLPLRDAFFRPSAVVNEGGIDPLLRGLVLQPAQEFDSFIVDDVRNFLFGLPGYGGFDLGALNLQRGRDHGLPRYNQVRREVGLAAKTSFADVSSNTAVRSRLASIYASVEDIDVWIGGLCEDPLPDGQLGELFTFLFKDQFERLRDGDRFWYSIYLSPEQVAQVEATTLSDIIRRNTSIGAEIPDDAFQSPFEPTAVPALAVSAAAIQLGRPFPNPSRHSVALDLRVPASATRAVEVAIVDAKGRRRATLHDGPLAPGNHRMVWNRKDASGRPVQAGVYFVAVRHAEQSAGRMFVVIN